MNGVLTLRGSPTHSLDGWRNLISACALSSVGALVYNVLPLFVGAAQDTRGLTTSEVGLVTAVFYFGYCAVTAAGALWIRRVDWRQLSTVCVPGAAAGLAAVGLARSLPAMLAGIALTGAMMGMLYGVCTTVIGDTRQATRNFGFKIGAEVASGIVLLLTLPRFVINRWGFDGLVYGLALVTLALGAFIPWLVRRGVKSNQETSTAAASLRTWPLAVSLSALLLFFMAMSGVWAFLERLGAAAGFGPVVIGDTLSASLLFGLLGAGVATLIGDRFGRVRPLLISLAVCLGSIAALASSPSLLIYIAAVCVFNGTFATALPIMVSGTAALDQSGRFVVLTVPMLGLGAAVGPAVAGLVATGNDYRHVMDLSFVLIAVAALLAALALRGQGRVHKLSERQATLPQ